MKFDPLIALKDQFQNYQRILIQKRGHLVLDYTNPHPNIGLKMEAIKLGMQAAARISPGISRSAMNRDDNLWNVRSITKSVLSLLVGIALDNKVISGLDERLLELIPDVIQQYPDKKEITLGMLLNMTSGLPEMDKLPMMIPLVTSKNWLAHILSIPLQAQPGEKYIYSTGASHVAACILQRAIGFDLDKYVLDKLFSKMVISSYSWEKDPQGIPFGGANLFLRPEDMLKLGQLVMQEGVYQSRQIISEKWIHTSTCSGRMTETQGYKYCLGWWRIGGPLALGNTLTACGFGGQRIYIRPEHEMITVVISRPSFYKKTSDLDQVMLNQVIPYYENS